MRLEVLAPDGVGEVEAGCDLLALVLPLVDLADGDVLVVTSKVVSKAEGRVADGPREDAVSSQTARVVARRGTTRIVRTHHGLTLAAAGVDASNVTRGRHVLLPVDPDASARALREQVRERTGRNVAVVVTDTAGRAWREGQTDIAIGAAGLVVLDDHEGRVDAYGNELAVTAPAVADEVAGAVDLAQGKLAARPVGVLRGRADLVLPAGEHGGGARRLVRPEGGDLFGYGAREAVLRAVRGHVEDAGPFGSPVDAATLVAVLAEALDLAEADAHVVSPAEVGCVADAARVAVLAFAHGWHLAHPGAPGSVHTLRPLPLGP